MFSPPETEHNHRFVQFGAIFRHHGIPVPTIYEYDLNKGYFLLEDVGSQDFLDCYTRGKVDSCLRLAFHALSNIQKIVDPKVPVYETSRLVQELEIFRDVLCHRLIHVNTEMIQRHLDYLIIQISAVPTVTVHRDYHCRNLLVRELSPYLGVVDFQDALVGPITYDLASLLYDCYWDHDQTTIEHQIRTYWQQNLSPQHREMMSILDFSTVVKLTALQRLLKSAGIFVRLWLDRQQCTHLAYVLPTLRKAQSICDEIEETQPLGDWLNHIVIPETQLHLPPES